MGELLHHTPNIRCSYHWGLHFPLECPPVGPGVIHPQPLAGKGGRRTYIQVSSVLREWGEGVVPRRKGEQSLEGGYRGVLSREGRDGGKGAEDTVLREVGMEGGGLSQRGTGWWGGGQRCRGPHPYYRAKGHWPCLQEGIFIDPQARSHLPPCRTQPSDPPGPGAALSAIPSWSEHAPLGSCSQPHSPPWSPDSSCWAKGPLHHSSFPRWGSSHPFVISARPVPCTFQHSWGSPPAPLQHIPTCAGARAPDLGTGAQWRLPQGQVQGKITSCPQLPSLYLQGSH